MCSQLHPQSPPSPMPSVAFYRNHKDWPSPVLCVYVCVCVHSSNSGSLGVGSLVECEHGECFFLSWAQGLQWTRTAWLWAAGTRALADGPVWHRHRDMWRCQGCLQMLPGARGGGWAARPPSALFLPQEGRPQVRGAEGGDLRKQMGQWGVGACDL